MKTRFTELVGCRQPIQLAGMAGATSTRLARAVVAAGCLGMVGVVPGTDLVAQLRDLPQPVGINFVVRFCDRATVEAAASEARLVEFFYEQPDASLVELAHTGGALVSWQVGSADEARAAEDAGCDVLIAQGVEAGGHLRGTSALLPLLDAVLDAVDVPVLAAGGIATARAFAAVLAAGADGARVGTRFLAAAEADVHRVYREQLFSAGPDDTVVTSAYSVLWPPPDAPHRVLRTAVEAADRFTGDIVGEAEVGGQRLPLPKWAVAVPTTAFSGEVAAMALYAGQGVGAVERVQPAADIVEELVSGAEQLLARW